MTLKNFNDTQIPQTVSTALYAEKEYNIAKEHIWKMVDIFVNGVTEVLRDIKSTENPVAFVFKKVDTFLIGAYVQYFPNEDDPSKPGNWTYTWTFYEDDLPKENLRVVDGYDPVFYSYFRAYGSDKHCAGFKSVEFQGDCASYVFSTIRKWLDENASETEIEGCKIDGVIEFKVQVENDEKVFGCEVDGEIKQLIKKDADIETN